MYIHSVYLLWETKKNVGKCLEYKDSTLFDIKKLEKHPVEKAVETVNNYLQEAKTPKLW